MTATMRPLRLLSRASTPPTRRALTTLPARSLRPSTMSHRSVPQTTRYPSQSFSSAPCPNKGIVPESPDPPVPKTEPQVSSSNTEPAPLSEEEYHEKADSYLERLVLALEEKAEGNPDYEIEYEVHPPSQPPSHSHALTQHPTVRHAPALNATGHVRDQQAAAEQADLAVVAGERAEALRLCGRRRGPA